MKPKACKVCRAEYTPRRMGQKVCSPLCAQALAKSKRVKAERAEAIKQTRADRERLKPRSKWMVEAQAAFNKYIRLRDANEPCICCGNYAPEDSWKPGGSYDAGHFLSVGAFPELRFVEDNCHKQKKSCNAGSGKYSHKARTVSQSYRIRLIKKIGIERVEWLEGPHEPKKYDIEQLKAIKAEFKAKARAINV